MDYISEIKILAQEGLRRDSMYKIFGANHHKWQFAKPANKRTIQKFEKNMKITLPQSFVRYLTELGNGGAGPDYGIYSLEVMQKRNVFIPQTAQMPVMLDHSMTDEQWADFAKKYEILDDTICSDEFDTKTKEQQENLLHERLNMELALCAGGVFIGTPGCTMNSILMCRGAATGEVFVIDFDYIFTLQSEPYCCGKFEDWIVKKMRKSLEL
ncbi:MAG: SMI1/KNR4 family protein [Ruminococcus sp.]|nr:SMI1/KNR4 family protein [Ruminococcus sp.]